MLAGSNQEFLPEFIPQIEFDYTAEGLVAVVEEFQRCREWRAGSSRAR